MSNLLNKARLKAILNFNRAQETSSYYLAQLHPNDCVTACLRIAGTNAPLVQAPSEGLTWAETQVIAAQFQVYLHPLFDGYLGARSALLLAMHIPSKEAEGHAHLILVRDGKAQTIFDPAKGSFRPCPETLPIWTHLAIVYSL